MTKIVLCKIPIFTKKTSSYISYEKLYIFKSSRNFWSGEIYIIGIGFKGIDNKDETILLELSKRLNKGETIYPMKDIPKEFCSMYEKEMSKVIDKYISIMKFFVYLIRNPDKFIKLKENVSDAIYQKNMNWINKYMKHLLKK